MKIKEFDEDSPAMKELINDRLAQLEKDRGIKILWAGESGSRAWGFASPDSDWDVRFIYVYPRDAYLSVKDPKEDITLPINGDLDFAGWELRKLLRLLSKSNASPMEWMQSPIVYKEEAGFREALFALVREFAQPRTYIHHYLGVMNSALKAGVADDTINIKKYFYILRPLFAARWVVRSGDTAPMTFRALLDGFDDALLLNKIESLWEAKEKAREGVRVPIDRVLMEFIESEQAQLKAQVEHMDPRSVPQDFRILDEFFRKWLP